jgi:hypothetical protein
MSTSHRCTRPARVCRAAAIIVGMAVVAAGCAPDVRNFSASHGYICPGDAVEIAWDVKGSASIEVVPATDEVANGHVADSGTLTVHPSQPTQVQLHVTRFLGHPTTRIQQIRMARPELLTVSLDDSTAGCDADSVWATVHARRFAPTLHASRVIAKAEDGRAYRIEHLGASASLAAGDSTTTFSALPVLGDWKLVSPLNAQETCGTPSLPPSLTIEVLTECQGGSQ